jgi:hypothetical protein
VESAPPVVRRPSEEVALDTPVWILLRMTPRKQKIDRGWVMASLDTVCPKCGYSITPDKIRRVTFNHVECPLCHEHFVPSRSNPQPPS